MSSHSSPSPLLIKRSEETTREVINLHSPEEADFGASVPLSMEVVPVVLSILGLLVPLVFFFFQVWLQERNSQAEGPGLLI